jgi:hypothetical protein
MWMWRIVIASKALPNVLPRGRVRKVANHHECGRDFALEAKGSNFTASLFCERHFRSSISRGWNHSDKPF